MEKTIWLTFDLGFQGDYPGLYAWLDERKAKECGDNVAVLKFVFQGDFITVLKESLAENIKLEKNNRIYICYQEKDKMVGKFVFGGRKRAVWEGYSLKFDEDLADA